VIVGVNGTEVCTSWAKTEILKAQQDEPNIALIMITFPMMIHVEDIWV
jgi:hypothetical protein